MDAENLTELETLMTSEADGRRIVLDLRYLTLVDQEKTRSVFSSAAKRTTSRSRIAQHISAMDRERTKDKRNVTVIASRKHMRIFFYG